MNTFRSMLRLSRPVANAATKRSMSAAMQPTMPNAASKGKNFNPKNFKEAWLSDVGVSMCFHNGYTYEYIYIYVYME